MSARESERKPSLDCVLWDESGSLERSSSDSAYNRKDLAILHHLQSLAERVEYLEHKLESSLSSQKEDLSFGLSVKNECNVPNVDIKVLSGRRDGPLEGEDVMGGWDDAIVERNTSFLIIPVGDDKDFKTNEEQLLEQTFGVSLKPSRPALCSPDTYNEFINCNERKVLPPPVVEEPSQTSAISMEIRPPRVTTFVQSLQHGSMEFTDNSNSKEKKIQHLKDSENNYFDRRGSGKMKHVQNGHQEMMTDSMSKLTTASPQQDCNNNGSLKYGYTVSACRSPINNDDGVKQFNHRLPPGDHRVSGQDVKHIYPSQSDIFNTFEDHQTTTVSTLSYPSYVVKSTNLPTQESVCYQDVELCEVIEYEDKLHDTTERTIVKIQRRISNENCVYSQANRCIGVDNQLKNSNYPRNEAKTSLNEMAFNGEHFETDDESIIEKELQDLRVTSENSDDAIMDMQIPNLGSNPYQDSYCVDNGSDGPYIPPNNAAPEKRLTLNNGLDNTNHLKDNACAMDDNVIQRDSQHHGMTTKPGFKKVRVRSLEIPYTSSDDDVLSVSSDLSGVYNHRQPRPPRRKPKNKFTKGTTSQDVELKLRELIDPLKIGNVREEIQAAYRPPLLLAVMSPTESGYAGSSANSPCDDWKDSSFTSVSPYVDRYPDSPYSPVTTPGSFTNSKQAEHPDYPHTHRMPYFSATSPTSVSDVSEYSEPPVNQDTNNLSSSSFGNTRLNDVLPGPARLPLSDYSPTQLRLNEFLLSATDERPISSPTSSILTSDLSDSFLDCQDECCQCQTGIATEDDFREELKSISRYVIEAGAKSGLQKKRTSQRKYYLDEEQGEMDIFGAKLQKGENRAVPLLVKVILRLRKHFFGGLDGPYSLKSLSPKQSRKSSPQENGRERKISFSPSAMLLSAVGESSASEIRDVIEKDRLDVNELSPGGKTLLHKAAASGNLDSIHTLIQYGALVNLQDEDGFVPIHTALRQCHYKCAVFLIECGTDIGSYTRTRIQELADINNITRDYKKTVLNTAL